jgi:hypothetical protein
MIDRKSTIRYPMERAVMILADARGANLETIHTAPTEGQIDELTAICALIHRHCSILRADDCELSARDWRNGGPAFFVEWFRSRDSSHDFDLLLLAEGVDILAHGRTD